MQWKNLQRYRTGGAGSKMQLSVPVPKTPDGRVYRYSPNESAHPRHFVLGDASAEIVVTEAARKRMKLEPRSGKTVCPYSGVVDEDENFLHPDDVKAAVATVKHAVLDDARAAFTQMFSGLNRGQSGKSFITFKVNTSGASTPKPRFKRRDLLRELVCDHCGRDYGVFAIGLFCPDCGAPNLRLHFARESALVKAQVELAEAQGEDVAELAYRLLGNAHEDVLTAFEATLKVVYLFGMAQRPVGSSPPKAVKNDFQNVERARERFSDLAFDPFDGLDDAELAVLGLNIQKRHIIGHNLGVVDSTFAKHASDARVGETVHLVGEDIRQFAAISQRVIDRLDTWLGGAPSPTINLEPLDGKPSNSPTNKSPNMAEPTSLDKLDLELGALARRLGCWMAEKSEKGLPWSFPDDAIQEAFPESTERDLLEAVAELQSEKFVKPSGGRGLRNVRPTVELFATFDEIALGNDPSADVLILAQAILSGEDSIGVAALHGQIGWPLRRFNPALGLVLAQIDPTRVSQSISEIDYPARSFHLLPEDRVALKRFSRRLGGSNG
ncbi:MAG: hypothetical protein ACT4QA_05565 [Panacagrimonas sp.]